jgi:hypothetical protein
MLLGNVCFGSVYGGWSKRFSQKCAKAVNSWPAHNFASASCILLCLLNHRESKGGESLLHFVAKSLARGTFNHSRMRRMACYCLILVPYPAVIAFGECLWHALLVKLFGSLFGTFLTYSSPTLWYFPNLWCLHLTSTPLMFRA